MMVLLNLKLQEIEMEHLTSASKKTSKVANSGCFSKLSVKLQYLMI